MVEKCIDKSSILSHKKRNYETTGLTRRHTLRIIHSLTVSQSHSLCANIALSFLHASAIDFSHQYTRKERNKFAAYLFIKTPLHFMQNQKHLYSQNGGTYA